jgi:WD40 repeat protein
VATEIKVFTDKVQNALWNPCSEYHLLTGCADGIVRNFDCRLYDEYQSFDLESSVESIVWNPNNEYCCYAGTAIGDIYALDFRSTVPLFKFTAHKKEVTGLAIDESEPKTLISVSTDHRLKSWNVGKRKVKMAYEEDHNLEEIHCIDMNPDYPYLACIGGSSETSNKNILKVVNLRNSRELKKPTTSTNETSLPLTSKVALLEEDKPEKRKSTSSKIKVKKKKNRVFSRSND